MKWLKDDAPDAVLFPIAEEPLIRALREAGFRLSEDPAEIDPITAREALHGLPIDPADAIMIGDRLATDVAMGIQAGMSTALVLTGDSTRADIDALPEEARPAHVLETLDQLISGAIWAGR